MKYPNILRAVSRAPWAVLPEKLAEIRDFLAFAAAGGRLSDEDLRAAGFEIRRGAPPPPYTLVGDVAIIPVHGTIAHRAGAVNSSLGTTTEWIGRALRAAVAEPAAREVVLDIDSPGGAVPGVPELAAEIRRLSTTKHITAHVNSMAASAAYWLASQASRIVVTPSGSVGSIGVFSIHQDVSKALEQEGVKVTIVRSGKFKAERNPYEPLTEEARAEIQQRVDAIHQEFLAAVAEGRSRGRDLTAAEVAQTFGQGRMVAARRAVDLGMVDAIGTLDEVLAGGGAKDRPTMRADDAVQVAGKLANTAAAMRRR